MKYIINIFFLVLLVFKVLLAEKVIPASERPQLYLSLLQGKKIALVVNHASLFHKHHLVDMLLKEKIAVKKIFAPEHGFRGTADAGAKVKSSFDKKTGLEIVSLYGKHKRPSKEDLKGIECIVFDIQDVGVRCYTYLSTLHYILEAGAEYHIPVIVLDRPNPNGDCIDGEVLHREYRSFVGLDPVPLLYGMTIGEYALMLNKEGWLKEKKSAHLTVIPLAGYTHQTHYRLRVKPSPNLPNERAVRLYASLVYFEGTAISAGRGTHTPFQLYGAPKYEKRAFSFVPHSMAGARYPKYKGKRCYGVDLSHLDKDTYLSRKVLNLSYLIDAYRHYSDKKHFFLHGGRFFDKLAGSNRLRKQIIAGVSETDIRKSWEKELVKFKKIRQKYLLYP